MHTSSTVPDAQGKFGPYGGQFVPETLMPALEELIAVYEAARRDPKGQLQKSEFMKTGGAVVDVCNGQPCTAVDP